MTTVGSRGRLLWLLALAVLTGLLALAALTAVALASTPDHSGGVSMALPDPYARVVEAVRSVCGDGVIHGSFQYESETAITGASESSSSPAFPQWKGSGEVFYKTRPGTISPAHFAGARDRGAVIVRYAVKPGPDGHARLTIDAVFVEDNHHGRHVSQGFVERAEFGEIAKLLKSARAPEARPATEAQGGELEQHPIKDGAESHSPRSESVPESFVPASGERPAAPYTRTYSLSEDGLKKALQKIGAFDDAALPMLEGFAVLDPDQLVGYDRPHYQFRAAFDPAGSGQTTVRIEARLSARYTDAAGSQTEYRSLRSSGRLETDLLDRLDSYLRAQTGTSASGAAAVQEESARLAGKK